VIDSQIVGTGSGRSKKDAEQFAARQALAVYPAPDEG
jgi:dsRNA-specific ribonuclease